MLTSSLYLRQRSEETGISAEYQSWGLSNVPSLCRMRAMVEVVTASTRSFLVNRLYTQQEQPWHSSQKADDDSETVLRHIRYPVNPSRYSEMLCSYRYDNSPVNPSRYSEMLD